MPITGSKLVCSNRHTIIILCADRTMQVEPSLLLFERFLCVYHHHYCTVPHLPANVYRLRYISIVVFKPVNVELLLHVCNLRTFEQHIKYLCRYFSRVKGYTQHKHTLLNRPAKKAATEGGTLIYFVGRLSHRVIWYQGRFLCPIIPTASEYYATNLQIADIRLCRT